RGLVDRRRDRARRFVGLRTRVNGGCLEREVVRRVRGALAGSLPGRHVRDHGTPWRLQIVLLSGRKFRSALEPHVLQLRGTKGSPPCSSRNACGSGKPPTTP